MALLKIKVRAKVLISWGTASLNFIRSVNTVKDTSVTFSSAVGQTFSAGQMLYSAGQQNSPGYIAVKSRDNANLNGSGVFNISVEHYPTATEGNRELVFNVDEAPIRLSLYYNSQPNVSDVIVQTSSRTPYKFTASDFATHYSDYDNDSIAQILISGNINGYRLNGIDLEVGQWIAFADIQAGLLSYNPDDRSDYYEKDNTWSAKDAQGNISVN